MMSPFVIALALTTFFGSPACEMGYTLMPQHDWYVLDDSGIYDESDDVYIGDVNPWEGAWERPELPSHVTMAPPIYGCVPGIQQPIVTEACL
jgi:hypothetical protein